MSIKTRHKYVVMKTASILTLLSKLPDELCSEIIDFANYEHKVEKFEVEKYEEEREPPSVDNYDEICEFKSSWTQFSVFCDFCDEYYFNNYIDIPEDDVEYQYDEKSNLKGICYISV